MPSREKLSEFTAWCQKIITGDEPRRSGFTAQDFLDRLLQAFDQPGSLDVGGQVLALMKTTQSSGTRPVHQTVAGPLDLNGNGKAIAIGFAMQQNSSWLLSDMPAQCLHEFMNNVKWRNLSLGLALITCLTLLQGCATPLRVDRMSEFQPQSKTVGMLTASRFDNKLRVALAKRGFTVLKFASNKTIIGEGKGKEIAEIYKKAESIYGLSLSYQIIDTCLVNDSVKINATLELADVAKNEVVFVIERGGWTGPCGFHGGGKTIFDELADAMAHEWENPK